MKLSVHHGDITQLTVDAVVNAANCELRPGSGVCGAIHRAAGPELAHACAAIGWTPTGDVAVTPGFRLRARLVIHAVGPVWIDGLTQEPASLHACYWNALRAAAGHGARTIAFPCISTGIYGYPPELAVGVALTAVADFARTHPGAVDEVVFCCFGEEDALRYRSALGILA